MGGRERCLGDREIETGLPLSFSLFWCLVRFEAAMIFWAPFSQSLCFVKSLFLPLARGGLGKNIRLERVGGKWGWKVGVWGWADITRRPKRK